MRKSRACLFIWFEVLFAVPAIAALTSQPKVDSHWYGPAAYMEVPEYLEFVDACNSREGWMRASLDAVLENGRHVRISAIKGKDESGFYLLQNGDMRWVTKSDDPLRNLSQSLVQGYNGGALDAVVGGQLHSLGGYGLWRRHFDLIRFEGGEAAWQLVATTGSAPASGDKDQSLLHPSNGLLYVLKDITSSETMYGRACYELFELNVPERRWTKRGVVDPRVGQIQLAIRLGSGLMAGNAAGELVWVDFKANEVKILPGRAAVLREFSTWRQEAGRTTFLGDSAAWKEFEDERFDLELPWDELQNAMSYPLVVMSSHEISKASPLGSLEDPPGGAALGVNSTGASWPIWAISALLFVMLIASNWSRIVSKPGAEKVPESSEGNQSRLSPLTASLISRQGEQFETEELDELLGIAHLSSPETLRSQRARLIARINTECRILNGEDLLLRKQSTQDRRRSIYVVNKVNPTS